MKDAGRFGMLSNISKHPIVTGVVLAILFGTTMTAIEWRAGVINACAGAWGWIWAPLAIPKLVFAILSLPWVLLLALVIRWGVAGGSDPNGHEAYKADTFFGILWRWSYDQRGRICNYLPHCPDCQRLCHDTHEPNWELNRDEVVILCQRCGRVGAFPGTMNGLIRRVEVEVVHAIETGRWAEVVRAQEENRKAA